MKKISKQSVLKGLTRDELRSIKGGSSNCCWCKAPWFSCPDICGNGQLCNWEAKCMMGFVCVTV